MTDIIDDAEERNAVFLRAALSKRKDEGPRPNGACHFCGAPLQNPDARWCDADCRDDWARWSQKVDTCE